MAQAFMLPRQLVEHSEPETLLQIIRGHTGGELSARQVIEQIQQMGPDTEVDYYLVTREEPQAESWGGAPSSWRVEAVRPQQQ